jgi:uncharacterized protein
MKYILPLLLVVLLFSCVSNGVVKSDIVLPAGESMITLASGAKGTILIASEEASPFVIMYHGYASSKDEVGNMFKDEAVKLQAMGISSLRIGYRGWDGPEFDETFITVHTMMEDGQEALDYVQALSYADCEQIGLLGFSMGGGVAQYIAGNNAKEISAVTTWSSSIEYSSLMSEEDKAKAITDGKIELDLGWRKITHSREFVESLDSYDPLKTSKKYKNALLIVDGTDDYLYANTAVLSKTHTQAEVYEINGADHIYHVLSGDNTLSNDAIIKTAQWFNTNL